MRRLLSRISPLLLSLPSATAFAAAAAEAAPPEQASPIVVIAFLVLLLGSCVGYGIYLAKSKSKAPPKGE